MWWSRYVMKDLTVSVLTWAGNTSFYKPTWARSSVLIAPPVTPRSVRDTLCRPDRKNERKPKETVLSKVFRPKCHHMTDWDAYITPLESHYAGHVWFRSNSGRNELKKQRHNMDRYAGNWVIVWAVNCKKEDVSFIYPIFNRKTTKPWTKKEV